MVGFPKVPMVNGDTDDDASIHMYKLVGRAQPLRSTIDDQLKQIWHKPVELIVSIRQQYEAYESEDSDATMNEFVDDQVRKAHSLDPINEKVDNLLNKKVNRDNGRHNDNLSNERVNRDNIRHEGIHDENYGPKNSLDNGLNDASDAGFNYAKFGNHGSNYYDAPNRALFQQTRNYKDNIKPLGRDNEPESELSHKNNSARGYESNPVNGSNLAFWTKYKAYLYLTLIGFILTMIYFIFPILMSDKVDDFVIVSKFNSINSKIDKLEKSIIPSQDFNQIKSDLKYLSKNYDNQQNQVNQLIQDLREKFINLQTKFNNIPDYNKLEAQLNDFQSIDSLKLQELTEKLNKLTIMTNGLDNLQQNLINKLIEVLPQHVPVYIKENKIHFIEEFHNYLFKFIDNYQKSKLNSTESYQPSNNTKSYKHINKSKIEELINIKLQENNQQIYEKINNFLDNLNINDTDSIHITKTTNEIFLNEILDIFNKGLIKINYGDYNLGARILGFLTNLNLNNTNHKRFYTKLFTGWFDYFGTNESAINNANNVLLDRTWQCQSNECSVGIRLFSPIIITDVFIKSTNLDLVSLYVKPSNYKQVEELKQYIEKFKLDTKSTQNRSKYIRKFFKIKSISTIDDPKLVQLKLPISLVNMRIPSKDIYLEFKSNANEIVSMNSIKVYGITEFNSYKYSQDFTKMIGSIQDKDLGFEDVLLGEDEY